MPGRLAVRTLRSSFFSVPLLAPHLAAGAVHGCEGFDLPRCQRLLREAGPRLDLGIGEGLRSTHAALTGALDRPERRPSALAEWREAMGGDIHDAAGGLIQRDPAHGGAEALDQTLPKFPRLLV